MPLYTHIAPLVAFPMNPSATTGMSRITLGIDTMPDTGSLGFVIERPMNAPASRATMLPVNIPDRAPRNTSRGGVAAGMYRE